MTTLTMAAVALTSALLTGGVRQYAIRNNVIDLPNQRSSHSVPTPRGGGVAFVLLFLIALPWLCDDVRLTVALAGGGVMVAVVGWIDDRVSLSARIRAFVHTCSAVWALAWLGGIPSLDLGFWTVPLGPIGYVFGILGIVWMINLYNFMDGIDGLAASEAILTAAAAGILLYLSGLQNLALVVWSLAAAVLGFLVWNWPPAKIFMGDVGSGFLGYTFAVLAIASEAQGGVPILVWIMLLAVFIMDATLTLLRRMRQGERWSEPHRTHAYQLATQRGFSHRQVTLAISLINVILFVVAYISMLHKSFLVPLLLLCVLVLAATWKHFALDIKRPDARVQDLARPLQGE